MRRVEESTYVSAKQWQCNHARVPIPRLLSFRPKRGAERRAKRRNLSNCTIVFAMYISSRSISSPYCNPARSFGCAPCGRSTQDDNLHGLLKAEFAGRVSLLPHSANARYCIAQPYSAASDNVNNITMPRSARRLRRAPFYCLKQIARA